MRIIRPSAAIIVRADVSVADCVRKMNQALVGSLLVVSDDKDESLVGIFTERDLLRLFDQIQGGGFWDNPVRVVMTRPVVTIGPRELETAGELMIARGIRHLPVVTKTASGRLIVNGVISIRDLFRAGLERDQRQSRLLKKLLSTRHLIAQVKVGVASEDEHWSGFIEDLLAGGLQGKSAKSKVEVVPLRIGPKLMKLGESGRGLTRFACIVLDLDGCDPKVWVPVLRYLNNLKGGPFTFLALTPEKHSPSIAKTFEKLRDAGRFAVLSKPIDPMGLLHELGPHLNPMA